MLEKPNIMFKHIENKNGALSLKGKGFALTVTGTSNCKMMIGSYPYTLYTLAKGMGYSNADIAEIYKEALSTLTVPTIFIHVTDKIFAEFALEHLAVIYYAEVPIGYGAGLQWHMLLYTQERAQSDYSKTFEPYFNRIKKEGVTVKGNYIKKEGEVKEIKKDNSDIKKLIKALKEVLDLKYSRISVLKANIKKVLGQSAGID